MKYVYAFKEGNKDMRELLGGKGANIAEMRRLNLPVPNGFTVTTEACNRYYEDNEKTYSISCGIMIKGYLLTINLYSASKEEVENAIKYIYSVEKIN